MSTELFGDGDALNDPAKTCEELLEELKASGPDIEALIEAAESGVRIGFRIKRSKKEVNRTISQEALETAIARAYAFVMARLLVVWRNEGIAPDTLMMVLNVMPFRDDETMSIPTEKKARLN